MASRFAHLRVIDSDSDSEDLEFNKRQNDLTPSNDVNVGNTNIHNVFTDAIKVDDNMRELKEKIETPIVQQIQPTAPPEIQINDTPQKVVPFESNNIINFPESRLQFEDFNTNVNQVSAPPETQSINQSRHQDNVNTSFPISADSSTARFPEKRGPPKRKSSTNASGSEKSNQNLNISNKLQNIPSDTLNNPQTSIISPLTLNDIPQNDEKLFQPSDKTNVIEDYQAKFEIKTPTPFDGEGSNQNVVKKEKKRSRNVENRNTPSSSTTTATATALPPPISASSPNTNTASASVSLSGTAVDRVLSQKYWEKTYGFDPSKRGMPLFVAYEHSPPKNAPIKPIISDKNLVKEKSDVPFSVISTTNNYVFPVEEKISKNEEIGVKSADNSLLFDNDNKGINMPLPEIISLDPNNEDQDGDVLQSNKELKQDKEHRKRDRKHRKHSSKSKSDVSNSIIPSESDNAIKGINNNEETEGEKKSLLTEENHQPHTSESINVNENNFINGEKNINSLSNINDEKNSNFSQEYGSKKNNLKSNKSNSILPSEIVAQEIPVVNVPTSNSKRNLENGSKKGSVKEENESDSPDIDLAQVISMETKEKNNKEAPRLSELTVSTLQKLTGEQSREVSKRLPERKATNTESSLFMTCISPQTTEAGASLRDRKLSRNFSDPSEHRRQREKHRDPVIPPFHLRLLRDMEEKKRRDNHIMERSLDEYTFHPHTHGVPNGRLPQRRHNNNNNNNNNERKEYEPISQGREFSYTTSPRRSARRPVITETPPTFKPEISKFARETQQTRIPFHERLYTPKAPSPRYDLKPLLNGHSPNVSPCVWDLIENTSPPIFHPEISPRARAIENGGPFYERLYPTKEELKRRRRGESPQQSPPISPRVTPRNTPQGSARLLERLGFGQQQNQQQNYYPDAAACSFQPEISPRAMTIENNRPFHERLYPEKEKLDRRRGESRSPPISPRRSPRTSPSQLSPRLLERHVTSNNNNNIPSYSFRPEITPRAMSMERQAPFHQRLYPTKEERMEQQLREKEKYNEYLASFQPSITERAQHAYEDGGLIRKNVVQRLTERKESPKPLFDPAFTFHPSITHKARTLKRSEHSESTHTPI